MTQNAQLGQLDSNTSSQKKKVSWGYECILNLGFYGKYILRCFLNNQCFLTTPAASADCKM